MKDYATPDCIEMFLHEKKQRNMEDKDVALTSIGRPRVKGGGFRLRDLLNLSIQLAGRRLIELHLLLHATGADGVEHAEYSNSVAICRVFGHVERDLHVTHGAEIVYLIGTDLSDNRDQVRRIAEVTVMEEEFHPGVVTIFVDMVYTACIKGG